MRNTILNGVQPVYTIPIRPNPNAEGNLNPTEELIWKEDIRLYSKRKDILNQNLASAYSLIWGQSSKNLQEKIKESPDYNDIRDHDDVIRLLREIRKISYKFEEDMQSNLSCFMP